MIVHFCRRVPQAVEAFVDRTKEQFRRIQDADRS